MLEYMLQLGDVTCGQFWGLSGRFDVRPWWPSPFMKTFYEIFLGNLTTFSINGHSICFFYVFIFIIVFCALVVKDNFAKRSNLIPGDIMRISFSLSLWLFHFVKPGST